MSNDLKKVLFTYGMSYDRMLIITDAPKESIESWIRRYNKAIENNEHYELFDTLKTEYLVKELIDSELDMFAWEMCELIGYDECYDLSDYIEEGDE